MISAKRGNLGNRASRVSAVVQGVKVPALSLQRLGSLPWCGFDPWPRNFHMLWAQPKKKWEIRVLRLGREKGVFYFQGEMCEQRHKAKAERSQTCLRPVNRPGLGTKGLFYLQDRDQPFSTCTSVSSPFDVPGGCYSTMSWPLLWKKNFAVCFLPGLLRIV